MLPAPHASHSRRTPAPPHAHSAEGDHFRCGAVRERPLPQRLDGLQDIVEQRRIDFRSAGDAVADGECVGAGP